MNLIYSSLSSGLFLVVILGLGYTTRGLLKRKNPHPPGPHGDPLIGHVRIIPKDFPWLTFAQWGKKWGGLLYVHILGKPMIIINDLKIGRDLLDKRGSIYSDRPHFTLMGEMMGWDKTLGFLPYGNKLRRQRKMMQQQFSSQAVTRFRPLQRAELYTMLNNFLVSPERFKKHIDRATAAVLTTATYGYPIATDDDPYVMLVEKATQMTVEAGTPGGALVDFVPALRYIPTWFPGAGFKRHALRSREFVEEVLNMPFNFVKQARAQAQGAALSSFVSKLLDQLEDEDQDHEEDAKEAAGIIFGAGFETTRAALNTFIFAMLQHPGVVERAQTDIDQVTGGNRMPSLEDRDSLPFIDAILKECLRWCPPVPLCIPHSLSQPDEYCGMHLPKDSTVVPNIWFFMHDEHYFRQPDIFDPDRFMHGLGNVVNGVDYDPLSVAFGFGRRICPGKFFAEQGLWLTMASIISAFNILPPLDDFGNEYMPEIAFTTGLGSEPVDFQCRIVCRSEAFSRLIQREVALE